MKVVHLINNLGSGGAEKLVSDIAIALKQNKVDCLVVILNGKKNFNKYVSALQQAGVELVDLNFNGWNFFQVFYKLVFLLKKRKIDVVHTHLFPTNYLMFFVKFFLPKKYYSTTVVTTVHSPRNRRMDYHLFRPIEKIFYKSHSTVICISDDIYKSIESWIRNNQNLTVLVNSVNLKEINQAPLIDFSSSEDFSSSYFNILMTARFDGVYKDHKCLVDALKYLDNNIYRVYFAGEGPYLDVVKEYVVSLGLTSQVFFLGTRSDIYTLMKSASMNILCSNAEGVSGVVLEGLAAGKPFLGSNVTGIRNIVPDERFLFSKGDSKILAEKIKIIKSDSHFSHSMVESALQFILKFDIDTYISELIKVYSRGF